MCPSLNIARAPVNPKKDTYVVSMVESVEQRKSRLAIFAQDRVKAKSDYQTETDNVLARTARLRAERLDREAVISLAAPKGTLMAASRPKKSALKAKLKASKRRNAV
ncbi:MAG: hypothetical protein ACO1NY_11905 [Pseudorhodoplanes sp.]